MTEIKGNYELRIAIIDLDIIEDSNYIISKETEGDDFLSMAENLGTIYSLGNFICKVNNEEIDNLTNSFIRAFLINCDNTEEIISVENLDSLYLYHGLIQQV